MCIMEWFQLVFNEEYSAGFLLSVSWSLHVGEEGGRGGRGKGEGGGGRKEGEGGEGSWTDCLWETNCISGTKGNEAAIPSLSLSLP